MTESVAEDALVREVVPVTLRLWRGEIADVVEARERGPENCDAEI
jgi:hypothetical protein